MKFTHQHQEGVLIIRIEESLIESDIDPRLRYVIEESIADQILLCAVDLAEVKHINSAGMSILIRMLTKFRYNGGEMALIQPSENIRKLLIITKLIAIFNIAQDQKEAIQWLKETEA